MRRPTPALVISILALFVACSGTAFATSKYLITSKAQVAPNVLAQLNGGVIHRTRVSFDTARGTGSVNRWVRLRWLPAFDKLRPGSTLVVDYPDIGATSDSTSVCYLQIRVDDKNDLGATGYSGTDGIVNGTKTDSVPVYMEAVFTKLAAGAHRISVWGQTDTKHATCVDNAGGFNRSIIATEMN